MNTRRFLQSARLSLTVMLIASCLGGCIKANVPIPATPTTQAVAEPNVTTQAAQPPTAITQPTVEPPTEPPTPEPTQVPSAQPTQAGLAILSFTCQVSDAASGKHLAFAWQTTGATKARIYSGTSVRFPQAWDVPANGTFGVDVQSSYYQNPTMTLIAYDAANKEAKKAIAVQWPCQFSYFFNTSLTACPLGPAAMTAAAQERFQYGHMVWVQQIPASTPTKNQIVVLYSDNTWAQYNDTWTEGEPETDPAITAPAGLMQPKRGFGKLWRTNATVKAKIGWAETAEAAYTAAWQWQMRESLPSVAYLRLIDNQVVELSGQGTGSWKIVAP